jgi:two-component system chemotaxis response regulator CheB
MLRHNIIVIGGSAGAIVPLIQLVQGFPRDLPAAVFIVVHTSPNFPNTLPEILQRSGSLPVVHPEDGVPIELGRIYVAPPDHHMLVKRNYIRVVFGPKENRFRPAIDPLFRTAAVAYKKQVVGVVLSGLLYDGTAGLIEIKERGGVAIVQDPKEAAVPCMPQSAIKHVTVDHVLSMANMVRILSDLSHEPVQ